MLDIQVTQGSYWKGAQIPYYIFIVLTIFGGLFGLDHLALRSPLTAILKVLSIIPLLGFWYFYDIAQAIGEREHVEKYGIAVPFYGPIGIGAGIFSGNSEIPNAPKEIPGPWRYMAYFITTCIFVVFPVSKFVLGDYLGGILHILMYVLFPLTFIAIAWSFYDIFHVLFKTKDIFENGVPHMTPASTLLGSRFRRDAIGPHPPLPPEPPTWFQRFFSAWLEVPISAGKAVSKTIDVGRDATVGAIDTGIVASQSVIKGVGSAVEGVGDATKALTSGVANVVVGEVKDIAKEAGDVASGVIQTAQVASDAVAGTVAEGAKAAQGTTSLLQKLPQIGEQVASQMGNPAKLMEAAKQSTMKGGALMVSSDMPSFSSSILLFTFAMVAFSGYAFYSIRNSYKAPEKSDEPPLESKGQVKLT
ncbi:MAG: hypothetical protein EB127_26580, partial [Alphaproteobacteria bacterium]|nr:hypothetical protein [Alphaproteobacteria bacterium]